MILCIKYQFARSNKERNIKKIASILLLKTSNVNLNIKKLSGILS